MKKFEVGKWYKHFSFEDTMAKFLKIENGKNDKYVGTEWIDNYGKYCKKRFSSVTYENAHEIPLSEIQQYLPEGHVDKIKESWCVIVTEENVDIINDWKKFESPTKVDVGEVIGMRGNKNSYSSQGETHYWDKTLSTEEFYKKIGYKEEEKLSRKCPYNHMFGEDIDMWDECEECVEWDVCDDVSVKKKSKKKPSTNNLKTEKHERNIKVFKQSIKVSRGQRSTGCSIQIGRPARTTKGRHQGNVPNLQEN